VWAAVADPQTWGKWFTVHDRWLDEPATSLAEGTRLAARIVMLGVANRIDWTVESIVAPTRLVLSGTGPAGVKVRCGFAMTPAATGSWFTFTGDFGGLLVRGAVIKAVEQDAIGQLDASLARLNALALTAGLRAPAVHGVVVRPVLRLVHGVGPKV
jgi:hypothetical protein